MLDLARFAEPVLGSLPLDPDEDWIFSADTLPEPPDAVATEAMAVQAAHCAHSYGNVYHDIVWFVGARPAFRALGVLLFSALFHGRATTLHLTGPDREDPLGKTISRAVLGGDVSLLHERAPETPTMRPVAFSYSADTERGSHPFAAEDHLHDWQRPCISWEFTLSPTRTSMTFADEVEGFGSAHPNCRMAALLLDIGHPETTGTEFRLEAPPGFPGMSDCSAELRLIVSTGPLDWLD